MSESGRSKSVPPLSIEHYELRIRIGKVSTNPFLNFLAVMRPKLKRMTAEALVNRTLELWTSMSAEEQKPYHDLAKQASHRCTVACASKRSDTARYREDDNLHSKLKVNQLRSRRPTRRRRRKSALE